MFVGSGSTGLGESGVGTSGISTTRRMSGGRCERTVVVAHDVDVTSPEPKVVRPTRDSRPTNRGPPSATPRQ